MEREGRRSQVPDSKDTAERSQSDSVKGSKNKEKIETDRIGKDVTGLMGKGLFGSAMIQKAFSCLGKSWDRFMINLGYKILHQ